MEYSPNSSSYAITISTTSKLSSPRSFMKCASRVTYSTKQENSKGIAYHITVLFYWVPPHTLSGCTLSNSFSTFSARSSSSCSVIPAEANPRLVAPTDTRDFEAEGWAVLLAKEPLFQAGELLLAMQLHLAAGTTTCGLSRAGLARKLSLKTLENCTRKAIAVTWLSRNDHAASRGRHYVIVYRKERGCLSASL